MLTFFKKKEKNEDWNISCDLLEKKGNSLVYHIDVWTKGFAVHHKIQFKIRVPFYHNIHSLYSRPYALDTYLEDNPKLLKKPILKLQEQLNKILKNAKSLKIVNLHKSDPFYELVEQFANKINITNNK